MLFYDSLKNKAYDKYFFKCDKCLKRDRLFRKLEYEISYLLKIIKLSKYDNHLPLLSFGINTYGSIFFDRYHLQ